MQEIYCSGCDERHSRARVSVLSFYRVNKHYIIGVVFLPTWEGESCEEEHFAFFLFILTELGSFD